jgi:RNA-directed DNA polymerase
MNTTGRLWSGGTRRRSGLRAKPIAIKLQLRRMMHEPVAHVREWLKGVVEGYYRYHAVPGNLNTLGRFRERLCQYWWQILRRRSQRGKPNWERLRPIFHRWIPRPRTLHAYPDVRLDARIQRKGRLR